MLGYKNTNKKTVLGGAGIAILLCALMVGMTMTNLVPSSAPQVEAELAVANEESEDVFALPEVYEPVNYEYDETSELEGMRTMNQKAFRTDDGKTALITAAEPLHYINDVGSWEEIDLNIKATVDGWEVTESLYEVSFAAESEDGVSVVVHDNVDPIVTGINPTVVTIDQTGTMMKPHETAPSLSEVTVGGNVLRYPIAEGFDLDYTVTEVQLKQNLVVRERPILQEDAGYFGVAEEMRLPIGYGLFLGDDLLGEDITQTQEELTIRNLETGEVLAMVPAPVVFGPEGEEPYHATFFVQSFGSIVVLTTAVDTDWLMEDERQFPLAIDPSLKIMQNGGGDCYSYYGWCYNSAYGDLYRNSYRIYYMPWYKYTFGSNNALPSGATVDQIDWKMYISYGYSYSNNKVTATVLENCGTAGRYINVPATATCSGSITPSLLSGSGSSTNERKLISSLWNSDKVGEYTIGTGWKTANICSSSGTTCSSTTGNHNYIMNAISNGGTIGMGAKYTTSTTIRQYSYNSGSTNSYLQITYSGGTDSTPPKDGFVPYTGITSYKEGARTFFTTLTDISGIDTTSSGAPHLHYSVNNGSYTAVKATTIGSCGSSDTECKFRATTGTISTGDYVNYFWAYKDASATPNNATSPSGGDAGNPSSATAPTSPYWFFVDDAANAGNDMKFTISTTDVRAYYSSSAAVNFDRQMTYYEDSKEYVFEFDTSGCGTGSNSCFYTGTSTFYANWRMMWTTTPSSGYNGYGGTTSGSTQLTTGNDGYLTISADDGPGMNLIFLYDSTLNEFAMVGLGTDTDIEEPLGSGTKANQRSTYASTKAFLVDIPSNITGTMGKFDWNSVYSSSRANWMCVGSNGFMYFFRSTSSNPACNTGYYYTYSTYYRWSGFALGAGYYGIMASSGEVLYKVAKVAPEPDTTAPEVDHNPLRDSHSRDRTFAFGIKDGGEPPTGINTTKTVGVGPTFYWRVTDANGTVGSWSSKLLTPEGGSAGWTTCAGATSCDWTTTLEDIERGASVEYYITVKDTSIAATGTNTNTTTTSSFEVGDPNKVFVVEWHDVGYSGTTNLCTYQALFYDVTNEIEFQYDTACKASYDYATVGYQDQTRTKGATLRGALAYLNGANPHSNNYRIGTDSNGHSYETFDLGMKELPSWDTAIAGSSNGYPYGWYCTSSWYWNSYKSGCNANIDMPDGFTFEYFGTEYNGSDTKNRVHIGRMGNMYFKADGSTALERSQTSWGSNWPELPYAASTYSRPGTIAPWWGYYTSYYCYDNSAADCSVRTRLIPFEGKGTDISADIVGPTTWSLIDSPVRINPSSASGYLSIGDDLTIEPGVVIQVQSGKGLSFDGACNTFNATGNASHPIRFEGAGGAEWKGLAFTAACSTGTDDRHTLSYVDFANTSDAAIAAGSRHGSAPSSSANVGNFTMDHVTFTNVGTAFKHGSGQGTVLSMTNFEVNDASDACFDLAEDSNATLRDGELTDCNSGGNSWGGAIINYPGSTGGALTIENVDIEDSLVNLIDVDFEDVWIQNLTATSASTQTGAVLNAEGLGLDSTIWVYNMDADGYSSGNIYSLESIALEDVDFGDANVVIAPGGTTSSAPGPYVGGSSPAMMDNFTSGDLSMARTAPSMHDITVGALSIAGNSPSTNGILGTNWDTEGISISGCGYNLVIETVISDYIAASCSNSAAPNNLIMEDVDATYTGTLNAIYARNSAIAIGDGSISMPSSYDKMSKASTNGRIVLIDVDQDGTDCNSASDCDVSSSSSGAIYFGSLATVKVYKLLDNGTKDWKEDHTVQATVVDGGSPLFTIGTHKTDANGETSVWVLSENDAGDTYSDHNLVAFGPSGQNETMYTDSWYPTGGFGVGDSIELRLEPTPVTLNGTNMDCAYLLGNPEAALGYDGSVGSGGTNTFTWEGKVTMTGDLNIDDCNVVMRNVFTVASDATNSPKLTISTGGVLTLEKIPTSTGALRAASSTYPLDLDMDGGTLNLIGGVISDIDGGINLDSGIMKVNDSSIIYGNANAGATVATLRVNGGTLDWDDSTIQNNGQTGIGIMFDGALGSVDNIIVKNAAVGIYSMNSAPNVNGFTLNDNDVGLDVYGGMSLPTLYRSTLLSGQSNGWTTHAIDMSGFLGQDYIQVGYNSVYGGGNAHPTYNWASSRYYMITDRMNVELTDNAGNSWNITSSAMDGYYDGSLGGDSGVPSWDCNRYGYHNNPLGNNWRIDWQTPTGWDWIANDNTPSQTTPNHYWGYYSPSWQWGNYAPPEGLSGYYNICLDYATAYRNRPGDSLTLTMPVVDLSGMNNITGMKVYLDMFHNRADNYQDRLEFVARSGDDPSDLGDYARESGTPLFSTGTITGADTGVELGGNYAAAEFVDITVTSPNDAGFEVVGTTTSTVDGLEVTDGPYGILVSSGASGSVDFTNVDISGTSNSGVYYTKDLKGDLTGTIGTSTGAGIKFGPATSNDLLWDSMDLSTNAVGIETAGSGILTFMDSDFANTKDAVISGSGTINFVEGTVDATSVEVTGSGVFNRLRSLDVTVTADTNAVSGTNVVLKDGSGNPTGSAITNASGVATGLRFPTEVVTSSGLNVKSLSGYEAVTVAKVGAYSYTSPSVNSGDFRYAFDSLSLQDVSGNSHNISLVNTVDARVCYPYTISGYPAVSNCPGLSTSGNRTYSSGMKEYGYYRALDTDMSGKVVMMDFGLVYLRGGQTYNFNTSTVIVTGSYSYSDAARIEGISPWNTELYAHNSEWVSIAVNDEGEAQGFQIGYEGRNYVVPDIQDSVLSGVAHIGTSYGPKYSWSSYYNWEADFFNIQNNTITHFRDSDTTNGVYTQDICMNSGVRNTTVMNNIVNNCAVGIQFERTAYSYYHARSEWGADGAIIEGNTFHDTEYLDVWFYLNSYADNVTVRNNEFTGSSAPGYNVYTQDRTTIGLVIEDNTFSNGQEPIYMRGGLDWEITDNTIYGDGDASHIGIAARNGYGVIDGNTLIDADGGILVDGITANQVVNITNNDISQSTGRSAPSAVGIWAEDCASSIINTGGNTVSVMENALVTDGCDINDSGSTFTAVGGAGGTVYGVQILSYSYSPQNLTINEGDSVRWRSVEYYNNSGTWEQHDIVANDSTWGSGTIMNLGQTYVKTFSTAGTYEYHCSIHPDMTGKITVLSGQSSGFSSTGVNIIGTTDDITLDGTSVSGFETGVEQYGGELTLSGDAIVSGGDYGVYIEDTDMIVDGARLSGDSTGTGVYVTGASSFDASDMDTYGLVGLEIDAVDFRWNGGDSGATTALMADGGAEGSVENVTWADVTTQIDAGSYVTVTSVGNSIDASKLVLDSTAVIHEGNLLNLNITHKGGEATDVGLLIKSTDGEQAAYVSPGYRTSFINVDGDLEEWYGNVKNPSDDAMPGVLSSDNAGEDFLATWDANNLYLALTGVDMGAADLQIYIDSSSGGDTTGQSWYVSHALPFAADYVFWAEDGTSGNSGLKVNGFSGWSDVSCSNLATYIGHSGDTDTELTIPWDCIGQPDSTVRLIVVVQDESTGAVSSVHPSQTIATGAVSQTFSDEITLLMGHSDLDTGADLKNHLLIYRSYVGSNTPTDAKTYDISAKVDAACAEDWGTLNNVDMSTNVDEEIDILRACPEIQNLVDITVNEDSGAYTLTLTDKADDVQDEESTLTWTVADDADPSKSPSMLLDSGLSGQTMTITPDHDQFGTYTFHFGVEDSHGLTDSVTIVFTVINVNDAPIICNQERSDCMPVFADDGDGNLNVLDEGFGSVSKVLGSAANATGSYVIDMASDDMANEQPQQYTWGATIKSENVTVEPYWVQKKFSSVAALFSEAGAAVTANGGFQDIAMTGDPVAWSAANANGSYTLPTLNDVALLTYLLAQNGCGTVWYQEYMDSSGNKVTAVRSDDGCDSTIDANAVVYNSMNYTDFWSVAYGVDVTSFETTWDEIFPNGYTTTGGYDPCPAYSVSVVNNELTITENQANELGGECTIILTLNDDGGYCENTYLGRTSASKAACVSYTWLIDYDITHPVYGPMTVTGCYNLYLGLASFIPEYLAPGVPSGMTEDICLAYGWVGENTDATPMEVTFAVTPVNDAPEVLDWDRQEGVVISDGNGEVPNFPWKVTLTEDDENVNNLTYDLSAMKHDNDHEDDDLVWSIVKADTCDYENYFSATIVGDDIVFDLIKDATTNAPEWERDYLNNGGIHQKNPLSGEFCPITLYLHDTETAPDYIPNYDMSTANYQQGEDSVTMYIRVDNVAENVPDYFFDSVSKFDYNEVSNIMPKTMVPTTVTIGHGGDEGPYNYDHMLEVTFYSNGYNSTDSSAEGYVNLGTNYVMPPAYGETLEVTDMVYITSTTTKIWVEMDVLTCVDENCDMTASPEDRYFGYAFPEAHACIKSDGTQGTAWSCPGEVGSSSVDEDGNPSAVTLENKRRPMLEDQDWCNNLMTTMGNGSDCAQPRTFGKTTIGTNQQIPTVVRLIGTADVPSFAPSLIAISAAGLFVSALVLQSRRDEEEEILEEMTLEDDEQAVSPVIATILMVAITVVLSGVIYVWASSLADTSAKGVPRMTFTVDSSQAANGVDSFHRITVTGSQVELATQAVVVTYEYTDPADGETYNEVYNLADPTVYGFYPGNSPSMVTFGDSVGSEGGAVKSSLDTGDTIYIRSTNDNGDLLENLYIDVSYVPNNGVGSVLRTWTNL